MEHLNDKVQYYTSDSYFEELLNLVINDQLQTSVLTVNQLNVLNQLPLYLNKVKRLLAILATNVFKHTNTGSINKQSITLLKVYSVEAAALVLANKTQLDKMSTLFAAHNIPMILLKGAAFNDYIYSKDMPRCANDIDILIKSADWVNASKLMNETMDYAIKPIAGKFSDLYEVSFKPKESNGFHVDMHKLLVHPYLFNISEEQLWQTSIEHPEHNNKYIRILSPENNIMHLALHAFKDMDFYTYGLIDCHRLINTQDFNWSKVLEVAEQWGAKNVLYFLLCNCSRVLGTAIPDDILVKCMPNIVVRKIASYLLCSKHKQPINNKKTLRYRIHQVLSQFIFTGSTLRPLKLQLAYLGLNSRY